MPIHDWTRVRANRFHHFHQCWTLAISSRLNSGLLPPDYFAMVEKKTNEPEPGNYAIRANRITVFNRREDRIAVVEVVSPGNKDNLDAVNSFARNTIRFLHAGVHFLMIDLFPPGVHDPLGMHQVIWSRLEKNSFSVLSDKPLTLASYAVGTNTEAYIDTVAVGGSLPDMPVFLSEERCIQCPLQATYQTAWEQFPPPLRGPLESPPA
jgi:hypothetical protein